MTVIICYYTPYLVNSKGLLILSFTFGNEFVLHSVLSLPTLLVMDTTINLQHDTLACSELQYIFILKLDSPGKGFLDDVFLNESDPFVPPGVHSNISSTISSF